MAGVVGQTEGGVKEVIDERRKGSLSLFPFALFSPSPPLPSPSFFVPATQAKESVAAEIYNSRTIQFLGFLGVLHSFSPWSVMFSKMLVL